MCCSAPISSSTCSERSPGCSRYDNATASANSAALAKWWKKLPVVTPARAAMAEVVAPARIFASGNSSCTCSPAAIRRSRVVASGPSVIVPLLAPAIERRAGACAP